MKKTTQTAPKANKNYIFWLRLTEKIQSELHAVAHSENLHYSELGRMLIAEALQARKKSRQQAVK